MTEQQLIPLCNEAAEPAAPAPSLASLSLGAGSTASISRPKALASTQDRNKPPQHWLDVLTMEKIFEDKKVTTAIEYAEACGTGD